MTEENLEDELLEEQITRLAERVLDAEDAKLHMESPRNIMDDLEKIIKDEIK